LKIDYNNFKDSITEKRRGPFYLRCWHAMWDMQHDLADNLCDKWAVPGLKPFDMAPPVRFFCLSQA